jgi:hypothetical protein
LPWFSILVSLAVILSSAFAVSPIRDAATLQGVSGVTLVRPIGYVVLAPLSGVLDMLTLLSRDQHVAFASGCLVLFAAWRAYRGWRRALGWREHLVACLAFLLAVVACAAATLLLPRPMAALLAEDDNVVRVDFHSHTSASRDARSSWTTEENRAWHRAGGYDVAYITDHRVVTQVDSALNPLRAGDGVTLLQGIEVSAAGEHVGILGPDGAYYNLLAFRRNIDPQALRYASIVVGREPIMIFNHPYLLDRLPIAAGPRTFGMRAIEVANGATVVMDSVRRNRASIVSIAKSRNVMMTTGSDSHGWGRTAPNWTLLMIINWRELSSDALAAKIENLIRTGGYAASRVVERRTADGTDPLMLALTVFAAPARMLTTLSAVERVAWLVWIALFVLAQHLLRRWRKWKLSIVP